MNIFYLHHDTKKCAEMHVECGQDSYVSAAGAYSIVGGAMGHWHSGSPGIISIGSVTITITDTSNPDGYVAIGRVFVGAAWQPALCIDWGYSLGIESRTGVAESLGGVEFFDLKRSRRTWSGKWSWLTDSEAFDGLLAIQKSHDIWREIAFILDDANPLQQNAFLGRFRQLSSIEHPYPSNYAMAVEVQEALA